MRILDDARFPSPVNVPSEVMPEGEPLHVCCIIPAYRASMTVVDVVAQVLEYADSVVVVDDCCPERSGDVVRAAFIHNPAVTVVERETNGGVGAATKTGIALALERGADVLIKIDADGQMDPNFIPLIRRRFVADESLALVKGNRFFDSAVLQLMPRTRLVGNAILSLLAKLASGYWNIIDPTNGYIAFSADVLRALQWQGFADSYFFELSVLSELGLKRLPILEIEMPTIYTSAPSSLSIRRVICDFPGKLVRAFLRRLMVQYFLFDVNLGTLYTIFGLVLMTFGLVFGGFEWYESVATQVPRATGTIMLAVLPCLMGFQLMLNALMYDVQFSHKTRHEMLAQVHLRRASRAEVHVSISASSH